MTAIPGLRLDIDLDKQVLDPSWSLMVYFHFRGRLRRICISSEVWCSVGLSSSPTCRLANRGEDIWTVHVLPNDTGTTIPVGLLQACTVNKNSVEALYKYHNRWASGESMMAMLTITMSSYTNLYNIVFLPHPSLPSRLFTQRRLISTRLLKTHSPPQSFG